MDKEKKISKSISFIIPTLNRHASLLTCLEKIDACLSQDRTTAEAIIVDSSFDDSSRRVSNKFDFARYLHSDVRNRSIQRNKGIKLSEGSVIAFLDDDSFIHKDWVEKVMYRLRDDNIDIVGGLVIDNDQELSRYHNTEVIGKVFPSGMTVANFGSRIDRFIEVDWLQGCNMAFKRKVFERIPGFDSACIGTAGYEETDLCIRAKKHGFKIYFDPQIVVEHVRGVRSDVDRDRNKLRGNYYASRNYSYFILKNFGLDMRKIIFIYFKETYWHMIKFAKDAKLTNFVGIFVNMYGKLVGTLLAYKYNFYVKMINRPLLK